MAQSRTSLLERRREVGRHYASTYGPALTRDLTALTEGWSTELRDELLQFFEEESTPGYWTRLHEADMQQRQAIAQQEAQGLVPPGSAAAFVGEAQSQLRQWAAARAMKRGTPEARGEA